MYTKYIDVTVATNLIFSRGMYEMKGLSSYKLRPYATAVLLKYIYIYKKFKIME
jgi:hypothetical protein